MRDGMMGCAAVNTGGAVLNYSYVERLRYHIPPQKKIQMIPRYHPPGDLLVYHVPPFFSR